MGEDLVSSYGILDLILVPLGLFMFASYHLWLYFKVRREPLKTVIGVNHVGRRAWVRAIMADQDKKNVLAVQTLRNSVMASSLFATTAIVLSSAIATIVTTRDFKQFAPVVLGSKDYNLLWAKFILIFVAFVWAFMCHIQSIRYLNHVSFLINIPLGSHPDITVDYVCTVLQQGSDWYTIGTRGFYVAFPLMLWLFGSIPMFISILVLLPFLHFQDTSVSEFAKRRKRREDEGIGWNHHSSKKRSSADEVIVPIPDID